MDIRIKSLQPRHKFVSWQKYSQIFLDLFHFIDHYFVFFTSWQRLYFSSQFFKLLDSSTQIKAVLHILHAVFHPVHGSSMHFHDLHFISPSGDERFYLTKYLCFLRWIPPFLLSYIGFKRIYRGLQTLWSLSCFLFGLCFLVRILVRVYLCFLFKLLKFH